MYIIYEHKNKQKKGLTRGLGGGKLAGRVRAGKKKGVDKGERDVVKFKSAQKTQLPFKTRIKARQSGNYL